MTRLVDTESGQVYELTGVSNVIGRSGDANVDIESLEVSRRHSMIRRADSRFWFYDLGSSNGSCHNGRRVTKATELENGDVIGLGSLRFRFEVGEDVGDCSGMTDDEIVETLHVVNTIHPVLLVSDIKGYTTLSEQLSHDELGPLMGSWYGACERILGEGGASIQDFAGDSVFAYWRTATPQNCAKALECARQLLAHSVTLGGAFSSGAALHSGSVIAGSMEGTEFRLLGPNVNIAFRVEGLTRALERDLLVTDDFLSAAQMNPAQFDSLGQHSVKGLSRKLRLYSP